MIEYEGNEDKYQGGSCPHCTGPTELWESNVWAKNGEVLDEVSWYCPNCDEYILISRR